jgi:hypothetical protein
MADAPQMGLRRRVENDNNPCSFSQYFSAQIFSRQNGSLHFADLGRLDYDRTLYLDALNVFKRPTAAICLAAKLDTQSVCLE